MTVYLPPKNEQAEELSISYCNACLICKANGYCYQNQDYDELVMSLSDAEKIVIRSDGDSVMLHRLLYPEETWFPKRRIEFIKACYAKVKGTVIVDDPALLDNVKRLFINANILLEGES